MTVDERALQIEVILNLVNGRAAVADQRRDEAVSRLDRGCDLRKRVRLAGRRGDTRRCEEVIRGKGLDRPVRKLGKVFIGVRTLKRATTVLKKATASAPVGLPEGRQDGSRVL